MSIQPAYREDELLNNDVRELISDKPHWFVRKGTVIFAILVLGLLILCRVVRYPEVIRTTAYFSDASELHAEMKVGNQQFGKIKIGQEVIFTSKDNVTSKSLYSTGKIVSVESYKIDSLLVHADLKISTQNVLSKMTTISAQIIINNKTVWHNLLEKLKRSW